MNLLEEIFQEWDGITSEKRVMPTLHQDPGPLQTSCFKGDNSNFELNYSARKNMMSLSSFKDPIWSSSWNWQITYFLVFRASISIPSMKRSLGMTLYMQRAEFWGSQKEVEATQLRFLLPPSVIYFGILSPPWSIIFFHINPYSFWVNSTYTHWPLHCAIRRDLLKSKNNYFLKEVELK